MSVTSQLKNKDSPLYQFLDFVQNDNAAYRFVAAKNEILSRINPIVVDNVNPAQVGTAFSYYLRWYMQPMSKQIYKTVAGIGINRLEFYTNDVCNVLDDADSIEKKSTVCYLLSEFEQFARNGGSSRLLLDSVTNRRLLPPSTENMDLTTSNSICDIIALAQTVDSVFNDANISVSNYISSPTFEGSGDVGGGDAVMIVDGILFDVRCTRKSRPMTINNLRQMISYLLLDYSDEYGIKACAWYYARQKMILYVPVEKLITNIGAKREALMYILKYQEWELCNKLSGLMLTGDNSDE